MNKIAALSTLALVALAACAHDHSVTGLAADRAIAVDASSAALAADAPGAVYALTNQAGGNAVAIFSRTADGHLSWSGSIATGGTGAGSSLGSQGALALSDDGRWLFAVNAGSNDVSAFQVTPGGLALTSRLSSGGVRPISLSVHGNVVYVLNAGGGRHVSGFTPGGTGPVTPVIGPARALCATAVGPVQSTLTPNTSWIS